MTRARPRCHSAPGIHSSLTGSTRGSVVFPPPPTSFHPHAVQRSGPAHPADPSRPRPPPRVGRRTEGEPPCPCDRTPSCAPDASRPSLWRPWAPCSPWPSRTPPPRHRRTRQARRSPPRLGPTPPRPRCPPPAAPP